MAKGLSGIQVSRVAAPLREQVLAGLREAILNFELEPGQRLVERELIEQIGVSRTTIREVLRELAAEGLVAVVPQKGAIVHWPSPEEAADLYAVRATLEALAVQRFVERATDERIRELRAALDEAEEVFVDGADVHSLLRAKDRMYETLFAGAASTTIQQMLTSVQARVRMLRSISLSQPGRPKKALAEFRSLVAAIVDRDVQRATELCTQHVNNAAATGIDALDEKRPTTE